eukprot:3101767-Pyramimonas_sp.AAC.1
MCIRDSPWDAHARPGRGAPAALLRYRLHHILLPELLHEEKGPGRGRQRPGRVRGPVGQGPRRI